jgi:hypothetical protein
MKVRIRFRRLHKWTKEEEDILKLHFHDMPFSTHNISRFRYLREKLIEKGIDVSKITEKSISRKTYRLGLRSVEVVNEPTHEIKCKYCDTIVTRPLRYKTACCSECEKIVKYKYNFTYRGKLYHKRYMENYKKKECEINGNITN